MSNGPSLVETDVTGAAETADKLDSPRPNQVNGPAKPTAWAAAVENTLPGAIRSSSRTNSNFDLPSHSVRRIGDIGRRRRRRWKSRCQANCTNGVFMTSPPELTATWWSSTNANAPIVIAAGRVVQGRAGGDVIPG